MSGAPQVLRRLARLVVVVALVGVTAVAGVLTYVNAARGDPLEEATAVATEFAEAVRLGWSSAERRFEAARGLAGMDAYFGFVAAAEVAGVAPYELDGGKGMEALVLVETANGPALLRLDLRRGGFLRMGRHTVHEVSEVGGDFGRLDLDSLRAEQVAAAVEERGGLYPHGRRLGASIESTAPQAEPAPTIAAVPPGGVPSLVVHEFLLEAPGLPHNEGIKFSAVDLEICLPADAPPLQPGDVVLVDAMPARYPSIPLWAPTPQLEAVEPGACARGWVTFGTLRESEPLWLEVLGASANL